MKKIFTGNPSWRDEYCEVVHVYALEETDEDLSLEFNDMSHKERCELFNVFDESNYFVESGAMYKTYTFVNTLHHIIIFEKISYNI